MGFDKFSKKELTTLVETLLTRVNVLEKQVGFLTTKLGESREEIRLLKIKKNSSNSSRPPSSDFPKPNQSLREKSSRKKGGQSGHKGHTLEFSSTPDEIVSHVPNFCNSCGFNLADLPQTLTERRQIIEIPPVKPIYVEHLSFSKTCRCGLVCKGTFPENVNAPIKYGPSIESLASYLSVRQYMPYGRMQEFFSSIFGLNIGQGSLVNMVSRFAAKCSPVYQKIKAEIQQSDVIGADETGVRVNGKKGWYFVWQNQFNSLISFSFSRGFDTIQNLFEDGFRKSVLVSDCWPAQLKTQAKAQQLCLAHLMRELNFFIESDNDPWAIKCKQLLKDAIETKRKISDFSIQNTERQKLETLLIGLLDEELSTNEKLKAFQKRLRKNQSKILTFLYFQEVPPDNNGSERAIRNVKVKQKISGQFIATQKAKDFAVIRSIIDSIVKRKLNLFNSLNLIAQL